MVAYIGVLGIPVHHIRACIYWRSRIVAGRDSFGTVGPYVDAIRHIF